MTELLTAAQMRAIEQAAIDSGEVTGLELMERAGRGVVEAILEWRPELATTSHRAVVLCGPGNNGGDGFVVARLLKQRGWEVEVFLYGRDPDDLDKLPPDAAENARRWLELGEIAPLPIEEDQIGHSTKRASLLSADVLIDAVFGIGLSRGFATPASVNYAFHTMMCDGYWWNGETEKPYIVAIDNVSELDTESGKILDTQHVDWGGEMGAHLTITFHKPKVGHFLDEGPMISSMLKVCDLGLADHLSTNQPPDPNKIVRRVEAPLAHSVFGAELTKETTSPTSSYHKYSYGHALILSGGPGKGGAARLAAKGALRIGAGLVTVCCPPVALTENAARLDAVMFATVKGVDGLQAELRDRKINAVCIGPGFGLGQRLREFLSSILGASGQAHRPVGTTGQRPTAPPGGRFASARGRALPSVVLDADALTEYRNDPKTLFAMLHERCVITPHEGEFGRLFPDILARLKEPATKGPAYSKVDATREAAKRAGCVVLFKGPDTVIADPDGRCAINSAHYDRAAPWLATAGSGDVLAGFITGLLARGFSPMAAAETAAWLHVECALNFGPGLIAEDLPEQLPAVFRELGL